MNKNSLNFCYKVEFGCFPIFSCVAEFCPVVVRQENTRDTQDKIPETENVSGYLKMS